MGGLSSVKWSATDAGINPMRDPRGRSNKSSLVVESWELPLRSGLEAAQI